MYAVLLSASVGACFRDDFLLGARCSRDNDCGPDNCCAGRRCRPATGDHCLQTVTEDEVPYPWAYTRCDDDDDCLVHGMPRCVHHAGAPAGFCADFCVGIEANCPRHEQSASRTCLEVDGQRLCALACCPEGASCGCGGPSLPPCPDPCPDAMQCRDGICVPAS